MSSEVVANDFGLEGAFDTLHEFVKAAKATGVRLECPA